MKQTIILTFILLTRMSAQDYFPLEVGNTWTYCCIDDTTLTCTYHIADSVNIGNKKYFLYRNVLNEYATDTIRKDIQGNIWKLIKGIDYLWFDFTKDSGAAYTFPFFDSLYAYKVEVFKNETVQTYHGTYTHCFQLSFDVPQIKDADFFYSFAPNVGPIEMFGGESPHYLLFSAVRNGVPLRVVNSRSSALISFELMQNYPNPFNPSTTIDYKLHESGLVTLSVLDMLGRQVTTLVNKYQDAGSYRTTFDGRRLTSGIYFYLLKSGRYSIIKKCLLLK